jgi:chromosome segregation ATPase
VHSTTAAHLKSENQVLKGQLAKALQLSREVAEVNSRNASLSAQLRESTAKTDTLQQRLRLSQQKNQELMKRLADLESALEKADRGRNDLAAQLQERNTRIASLQESTDQHESEKRLVLTSCSSMFGLSSESIPEALEQLRRSVAAHSEKLNERIGQLEKEKSEAKGGLETATAQLEKAKRQTVNLKKRKLNA